MQDNRLCQIYIYWSSDNYMYCILPIKDAHPNTAPHTWGGGTKIIFIAWPNQVLQISQHISTPFNNLETCILLKKCLTLAMSPTCHNNNAGLPVGNSISGHIILGHFRPILCFWGMRLNFFYSVPIERTRQTTDNRQKVMHMSPPCKLHRWAQKSYTGLISLTCSESTEVQFEDIERNKDILHSTCSPLIISFPVMYVMYAELIDCYISQCSSSSLI